MSEVLRFRQAMARYLGQELTPEIAVAIEMESLFPPDHSIDPGRFPPLEYGGYVIGVERLRDIFEELRPLHEAHYVETEIYRHNLPLNPDYLGAIARERAGGAIQFTVRKDGELVGQLLMYHFLSQHTKTPVSEEDALFIRTDHRGGMLVMKLLRYAEGVLTKLYGPHMIRASSKLVNRADVLMRRLGYQPFALQFFKFTGDSDAQA